MRNYEGLLEAKSRGLQHAPQKLPRAKIHTWLWIVLLGGGVSASVAAADPTAAIQISDVSAPHPKHCIDERQWRGLSGHTPFQLFDGDLKTVWQPCRYALKDQGYTIDFDLEAPVLIDGIAISQVSAESASCLLYTSPSPRDISGSRMPSSA